MPMPMTQETQVRLMKRVCAHTPGGGGSSLLHLLQEAVRVHAPNPEANDHPSECAASLENLAQLATAAAALLRDADWIAANADVFAPKEQRG